MAKKNRNDITSSVGTNIYDNNNKEILASMVRLVMDDYRDSFFNLLDDRLKNTLYDGNTTLEQHLAQIVGSLPVYGTIEAVNVGENLKSYTTRGIITSAKGLVRDGNDFLLEVNFSQSVSNRRLIPLLTTTSNKYNDNNDICTPVIRRISSTRINMGLRQVNNLPQSLNIEIIAL